MICRCLQLETFRGVYISTIYTPNVSMRIGETFSGKALSPLKRKPIPQVCFPTKQELSMIWTDRAIATLTELWEKGMPTTEIGRHLHCSKNSVVSKAHRLNLSPRPSPIRRKDGIEPIKRHTSPGRRVGAFRLVAPAPETKPALRVYTGPGEPCLWMVDGPQCTELAVPGRPYCQCHCERAYVRKVA